MQPPAGLRQRLPAHPVTVRSDQFHVLCVVAFDLSWESLQVAYQKKLQYLWYSDDGTLITLLQYVHWPPMKIEALCFLHKK